MSLRGEERDVAVDLRDVLPLLREGGGEEFGEVLLEEAEDQNVAHGRQGDDEDDQEGDPQGAFSAFTSPGRRVRRSFTVRCRVRTSHARRV